MSGAGRFELSSGASTAFVHDYMTQLGGAERVAGRLAAAMPLAELFTSIHDAREVPLAFIGGRAWRTSYLQPATRRIPLKAMLALLPSAVASLDVSRAETLLSSSSAFAHHARKAAGAHHVCYCCTPPRFLWASDDYFRGQETLGRALSPLLTLLRRLDLRAAARVDNYVAVSRHIASRIRRVYGRDAEVVYPPVDVDRFAPTSERSGRFLVLSRLVRSKRVEVVIEAANRYSLPLDVVGMGPELQRLQALAGPTVRFHGWQPDAIVRRAIAESSAVVISGEEDFGLVAAEAQASGRPPVAFAAGGSLEIIEDGVTGYLFSQQTVESAGEAMLRARDGRLDATDLVASARRFDLPVFFEAFQGVLDRAARPSHAAAGQVVDTAPLSVST